MPRFSFSFFAFDPTRGSWRLLSSASLFFCGLRRLCRKVPSDSGSTSSRILWQTSPLPAMMVHPERLSSISCLSVAVWFLGLWLRGWLRAIAAATAAAPFCVVPARCPSTCRFLSPFSSSVFWCRRAAAPVPVVVAAAVAAALLLAGLVDGLGKELEQLLP